MLGVILFKAVTIDDIIGSSLGAKSVSDTTVFKVSIDCKAITYSGVPFWKLTDEKRKSIVLIKAALC
jgi:hypothetical protein